MEKDVHLELHSPRELSRRDWRDIQLLGVMAYSDQLDRPMLDIDELMKPHDPERYYLSHVDPNSEVGRNYAANQSFSRPRVALAKADDEIIGYAYSANNVSGASKTERFMKRMSIKKNYLWMREVFVHPEKQRQQIATQLGRLLLVNTIPLRNTTAYIWPDEIDFLQETLERIGFSAGGESEAKIFGERSDPVRQVRMQAQVHDILAHLSKPC